MLFFSCFSCFWGHFLKKGYRGSKATLLACWPNSIYTVHKKINIFVNILIFHHFIAIFLKKMKNLHFQKKQKQYLFATHGYCHKHHILLHISYLLSYYFRKSINKWWKGADLKLALRARAITKKKHNFKSPPFLHLWMDFQK